MLRTALNHRKFKRLAEALGIPRFAAVGLAECLWHLTATQAPQGDIGKLSDAEIAEGVFWPKRSASKLIEALASPEVSLLDRCNCHRLRVHDWNCHADQSVKKTLSKNRKSFCSCYSPDPRSGMGVEQERNGSGLPEPEPEPEPEPIKNPPNPTNVRPSVEAARVDLRAALTVARQRHPGKTDQELLAMHPAPRTGAVIDLERCDREDWMRTVAARLRTPVKAAKARKGDPWGGEPDEAQAMLEFQASNWLIGSTTPRTLSELRATADEAPEDIRGAVTMILFARNPHLRGPAETRGPEVAA